MILKQFYLPCLAHASYVIGDEKTGTAVVVAVGLSASGTARTSGQDGRI